MFKQDKSFSVFPSAARALFICKKTLKKGSFFNTLSSTFYKMSWSEKKTCTTLAKFLNPFPTKPTRKIFIFNTQNFMCGAPSFYNRSIFIIFVVQVSKDRLMFDIIHVSSYHFQNGRNFLIVWKLIEISVSASIKI